MLSLLMLQLDIVVLQYQNQKLTQKLETQKLEYAGLENRFSLLKESQKSYDSTLAVVKKSWEQVIGSHFIFAYTITVIYLINYFSMICITMTSGYCPSCA